MKKSYMRVFLALFFSSVFLFSLSMGCGGGTGGTVDDDILSSADGSSSVERIGGKDTSGGGGDEGVADVMDEGQGDMTDGGADAMADEGFQQDEAVSEEPAVEPEPTPQPPQVVSTTPKDGEKVEQPVGKPIVITIVFDQEMDPATLNDAALDIQPPTPGKVSVGPNNKSMIFTPDNDLKLFQKYTVTVKNTVASKAGINMQNDYTFSFETKPPGTEPAFLSTFSSAGGTLSDGTYTHHAVFGGSTAGVGMVKNSNYKAFLGFYAAFTF